MQQNENSSTKILKRMIIFSVPLILSGLLQQLFNWVDALIVGNIIGETALAGVGATSSLYNLLVTVIVAFTSGLSVLFAQQFGEGKSRESTKVLASYTVILTSLFVVISVFGIICTVPILKLMDTPQTLFLDAKEYLCVIFAGIPFLAIYNMYSAALRGMGNSHIPFIAVLISSITNAVMDVIFVVFGGAGVAGAAFATVLSQFAMTVYIVAYTIRKYPALRFSPFNFKEYHGAAGKGAKYGMPPAVQNSISSIGNLFLQRFMNGFGEATVAAITTAYRVDTVLLLPIINLSTAISTLVAQQIGADNKEGAKKVFKLGLGLMIVMSLILTAFIIITGRMLLGLFGLGLESIAIGERFFRTIAVFYVVNGLAMSIKGYLEGSSDLLFSAIMGICALAVRIVCSYLFVGIWGNMVVAYAEAFSWVFLVIVFSARYIYKYKAK